MAQVLEKPISVEDILRSVRGPLADWLEELDKNEIDYRVKINLALTGIWGEPCSKHEKNNYEGCKWPRTKNEDFKIDANEWCCSKCSYPLDIKYMSLGQLEMYKQMRELENKKLDFLKHPENEPLYLAILSEGEISEIIGKVSDK